MSRVRSSTILILTLSIFACQEDIPIQFDYGSLEVTMTYYDKKTDTYKPDVGARIHLFYGNPDIVRIAKYFVPEYEEGFAFTKKVIAYEYEILNGKEVEEQSGVSLSRLRGNSLEDKIDESNEVLLKIENNQVFLSTEGPDAFGHGLELKYVISSDFGNEIKDFYGSFELDVKKVGAFKNGLWKLEVNPLLDKKRYEKFQYDYTAEASVGGIARLTDLPVGECLIIATSEGANVFSSTYVIIEKNKTKTAIKNFDGNPDTKIDFEDWQKKKK